MSDYTLPPSEIIHTYSLSKDEKTTLLHHLFEPCPALVAYLLPLVLDKESPDTPYESYQTFIEYSRKALIRLIQDGINQGTGEVDPRISEIIAAHPRLGARKVDSQHSQAEQKSLEASSVEEAQKLHYLNNLYEKTFPGLRYVVFVNGRSREVIMNNITERIERHDIAKERIEAINAMCDIAKDRAKKIAMTG
ncbi:hypothetical protein NADFUDRAFT_24746 [Nadsonia fulvescens var. elongata DSM 6958]|uniref:Oxo-4-hydroxy-4-carboxy-5-ureidoimidazoline decarboxylase domain-containing protein n=1 Tax=Nadsonia fulvescens var. elongata DSM 6958 TaxID=857566 RepID=A0A1E3PLM8_9ASCO|nr:hypothetical protein NADFUDRAFT_24746 [Nadsonia fulvescens var. elongata DSM 6958]